MIVLVLTRAQAEHLGMRATDMALCELIAKVLESHDLLPEPDNLLPAAISLRHDGIVGITFADATLANLVWEGLSAEKRPSKKKA